MFISITYRTWLVGLLAVVTLIVFKGYTFNSGDHEEHLPQVYKLMDSSIYPHDYFVTANEQSYSPRLFFVWLIYLTQFIMPVSAACFLFYVVCLTITAWVIQQLALFFYANNLYAQIVVFSVLLLFNTTTVGGNALINSQLMCSTLSTIFCALAVYFIIKKKWYSAAVFAGIATLFQVLVGLHLAAVIGLLYVFTYRRHIKASTLLNYYVVYLLVSAPMLFPMLFLQGQVHSPQDNALYYHILYYVRNPNHYLPSAFPRQDYIHFIALSSVAFALHFFVNKRLKKCWRWLMLILIGGMVGYTLLLQGLHFMPIGKLQWFKVCSWAMVMHVMVIGYFITSYSLERIRYLKRISIPSSLLIVAAIAGFIFIFNSGVNPIGYFKNRYHIGNYIPGDREKMHYWIRANTPVDCIILTDPYDDSFLCEAQRSMPVGFKAIIHQHFFLIPWYKNFKAAYHNNQPFTGYVIRKPATDHFFKYPPLPSPALHWDYRLTDLSKGIILPQNETIVHRINSIVLVKVIS